MLVRLRVQNDDFLFINIHTSALNNRIRNKRKNCSFVIFLLHIAPFFIYYLKFIFYYALIV